MSSSSKKDLTTKKNTTKPADTSVIGDTVVLPPTSDDVIFTTICDDSISGTVNAELEMSPDNENWCPALTEEYAAGETVEGWGNEKFLLTKAGSEVKNKHAKGSLNFDTSGNEVTSGGTRDVLFNFIQRDKPFNLSWWHKSEDQPDSSYNPIIFRHGNKDPFTNNKHLNLLPDAANNEKKNKHLHAPANIGVPARDIFHEKMGADKSFTINKWFKSSHDPASWTTENTAYTSTKNYYNSTASADVSSNGFALKSNGNYMDYTNYNIGKFNSSSGWAMSFWVKKPAVNGSFNDDYRIYDATDYRNDLVIYVTKHGVLTIDQEVNNEATMVTTWSVSTMEDDEWHHVLFQYTGSANYNSSTGDHYEYYLDGVKQTQTSYTETGTPDPTDADHNGQQAGIPAYLFGEDLAYYGMNGRMTEVSLWNKFLTSSEISDIYNDGKVVDVKTLSFFSASNCATYLTFMDDNDALSTSTEQAYSLGTNSIVDQTTNGNNWRGWINSGTASPTNLSISSDSPPPVADSTYTDTYLPVLFNNGAKNTVTNFQNTKSILTGGRDSLDDSPITSFAALLSSHTASDSWWHAQNFIDLDKNWSYSLWFKLADVSNYDNFMVMIPHGNTGTFYNYYLKWETDKFVFKVRYRWEAQTTIWEYPVTLSDDTWYNVTMTNVADTSVIDGGTDYNYLPGTNFKLYLNGSEVSIDSSSSQGTAAGSLAWVYNTKPSTIGSHLIVGGSGPHPSHLNPALHELTDCSIWGKTLSSSEVSQIYGGGTPIDLNSSGISDLTAWWRFGDGDNGSGTADSIFNSDGKVYGDAGALLDARIYDMSGNSRHLYTLSTQYGNTYDYIGAKYGNDNASVNQDVATSMQTLDSSGDGDVYIAPSTTDKFGNGLTASFTKKVVTSPWGNTKVWSNSAGNNWHYTGARGLKTRGVAGDNSETPLIRGDRDWTFSFWMKTTFNNNSQLIGTTDIQGTGTGWEDQFCIRHDDSWMYFQFNNSAGTATTKKIRMSGQTNMDGTPDDGEWHFYVLTFNANGNSTADADFEFMPTSSPDSTRSLTLYIDGQVCGTAGGASTIVGTVSDCAITDGNKDWHWFSRPSNQYYAAAGQFNQLAVFDEYMTASEVAAMYDGTAGDKGGKPTNVSTKSSCKVCIEFETESFTTTDNTDVEFVNSAYSGTWANDSYRTNKTVATSTLSEIVTITSSDNTYSATTVVNTFDEAAAQGTSFLLSLDGFESDADAWVSYPVGSLLDGNWHNMQITWDGSGAGSKTYDTNLKVFVDGTQLTKNASKGGSSTFTAADKHFKWTTGTFVPGTFGASGWKETSSSTDYNYAFQGAFDQLSLHSEATDLTKAQEFYGKGTIYEGQPHNYQMSDSLTYANVEGWWTFDEGGDSTTVANDKTSNNIDLTLKYFDSNGNNLTSNSGQSIYIAPIGRAIGEGFTVSITKNLKDDGSWVTTQDQTTRLVLSFNGIESLADHFVAYNVNQTGLSKPTNLLDGLWHNVVISFQGTTDNSGTTYLDANEIRFGPVTQGSVIQNYHISVSFDGQTLENLVPGGSADQVDDGTGSALSGITGWDVSKKLASGKMEAGFVIEQKHLRHVNTAATYVPTTYLASGLMEDSGDGKYAFQGGFDESSFHSDNWWVTADGTLDPNAYNKEKAKTIYGNTGGLETEQLTRRAPYDLRDPSTIGATSGSNQYVNPTPYDAVSNDTGGLEVYYRWGDTLGDCSESIRDVKSHESEPVSLARDLSAEGSMEHATLLDTDASESTDFAKDLTYDNSGTYKMYVQKASSTTEGGLQTNSVKISGCGASKCQQQGVLAPKLQYMRVKWTGAGSCNLGEDKCRAQLWFRRRKK